MSLENKASIIGRMVIKGTIRLESPLLIGDGTGDESLEGTKDIHVLKDKEQRPFIPGTSLAGVLRDNMYALGNSVEAELLFGNAKDSQSMLQIEDIILEDAKLVNREGVKIDSYTGTAVNGEKFDYEAVERGAKGTLTISLILRNTNKDKLSEIRKSFIILRNKLEAGIAVGAMTATGFGSIKLEKTASGYYDFLKLSDVKAWLTDYQNVPQNAADKLNDKIEENYQEEDYLTVDADFAINSAMLIREMNVSEEDKEEKISATFKKSGNDFVIPGTSMKGVLRHHAEFILDKLGYTDTQAAKLINNLMGYSESDTERAKSRLQVREIYFKNGIKEFAQPRTRIDRFTGGVIRSALFQTKPVWQKETGKAVIKMHFEIRKAKAYEAGLAMLLLRDLWLGRVAIGGEKSIGRGTLQGISAIVNYNGIYELAENGKVIKGDKNKLENYAKALKAQAAEEAK